MHHVPSFNLPLMLARLGPQRRQVLFFVDKHLVSPLPYKSMSPMKVVYEMLCQAREDDELGLVLYDDTVEVEIRLEEVRIHRKIKKLMIENLYRMVNTFELSTRNNVF